MRINITFQQHDLAAEKAGRPGWTGTKHFVSDDPENDPRDEGGILIAKPDQVLTPSEMAPFLPLLDKLKPARSKSKDAKK